MPPSVIYVLQSSPAAFKYIIAMIYQQFSTIPYWKWDFVWKIRNYSALSHIRQ